MGLKRGRPLGFLATGCCCGIFPGRPVPNAIPGTVFVDLLRFCSTLLEAYLWSLSRGIQKKLVPLWLWRPFYTLSCNIINCKKSVPNFFCSLSANPQNLILLTDVNYSIPRQVLNMSARPEIQCHIQQHHALPSYVTKKRTKKRYK